MLVINDLHDVYCDALVEDDGYLVFASCWGRDTAIQELLARLTLSSSEGGLNQLQFQGEGRNQSVRIGNPDRLDKMTGRMPKANLFGDLVHLWLFDKKARSPDYVNRQAYLLQRPEQDNLMTNAWYLVKDVCHLPLLDQWQAAVTQLMREQRWLTIQEGYEMNALRIDIPEDEFDREISLMITAGQLTV